MGIANAFNTAQEAAEQIAPSPEAIKAAAMNTCRSAINTVKGSGYVTTEIGKIKDRLIDLPVGMAANTLKASTQLLTLQPLRATGTLAGGLIGACKDATKLAISPVPTGIAAVKSTARTAVEAAKLPVTVPLAAYRKGSEWVERGTDIIFGPDTPGSSGAATANAPAAANDNAGSGFSQAA